MERTAAGMGGEDIEPERPGDVGDDGGGHRADRGGDSGDGDVGGGDDHEVDVVGGGPHVVTAAEGGAHRPARFGQGSVEGQASATGPDDAH